MPKLHLNALASLILPGLPRWSIIITLTTAVVYINHKILTYTFGLPCLVPDSASYLDFSLTRTVGYPLLIKMIMNTYGDLGGMVIFQLNFLLGSFIALGYAVGRLTNSRFLALLFTLLLFSILPLLEISQVILTEATFAASLCFHFAAVALYLKKHSAKYAILSGLTLIITILIRPAAYPLVGGILLLLLLLPKCRKLTILAVAGPFIFGVLAASTFNLYKFGVFGNQSLGGMALLGQVVYVLESDDGKGTQYEQVIKDIVKKNESEMDKFTNLDYPEEYWQHTMNSYNKFIGVNTHPIVSLSVQKNHPDITGYELQNTVNNAEMDISLIGIKSNPGRYARHVIAHYFGAWQGFLWDYGDYAPLANYSLGCYNWTRERVNVLQPHVYKKFLDPSDFADEGATKYKALSLQPTLLYKIWQKQVAAKSWLIYLLFTCSILALIFVLFRKTDATNRFIFYTAILLHAYLVFVASVQATLERYSLPFTTVLYLLSFLVIFSILKYALSKLNKLLA